MSGYRDPGNRSERSTPQNPPGSSNNGPTNMPRRDQQQQHGTRRRGGNINRPSQSTMRPPVNQNAPFPTPAPSPHDQQRHVQFNPVGAQDQENQIPQPMPPRQRSRNQSMPPNAERRASQFNPHAPEFFPAREMNQPAQINPDHQFPQQRMQQQPVQHPQMMQQHPVQQEQLMQQRIVPIYQIPQHVMQQPQMQHPQMVQDQFMMPPQQMVRLMVQPPQAPSPAIVPSPQIYQPMPQPPPPQIPPPQLFQNQHVMNPQVAPNAAPQPPMPPPQPQQPQQEVMRDQMHNEFRQFIEQLDQRFEQLDQRFGQMDQRFAQFLQCVVQQQNHQLLAMHNLFAQHLALNRQHQQQEERAEQREESGQPSASQQQEHKEDLQMENELPTASGSLPENNIHSDTIGSNKTAEQKTDPSSSGIPPKTTPETSEKEVQVAPEIGECIPTQTDAVNIVDEKEDLLVPLTNSVDESEQHHREQSPVVGEKATPSEKPVEQVDDTSSPALHQPEESEHDQTLEDIAPPVDIPEDAESAGSLTTEKDLSKVEESQKETGKDEKAKKGSTAKIDKKALRVKMQKESKKKIEKSDEDALAELDDYRSFINLLPAAIGAYVKCEHNRRHTFLAFQNSTRIEFSESQESIADYWKTGRLVGIHQNKCSPDRNIQQRFDEIIQSCRHSDVLSEMKLAIFMQSVLDSPELIIEEDLIFLCDITETKEYLKVSMEMYCDVILSYQGQEPTPVEPPCAVEDFANVDVPFAQHYLDHFRTYINEQYIARYERKDESVPLSESSLLASYDRENEKYVTGWMKNRPSTILEFQINIVREFEQTDETRLFIQFYTFLKTIRSSILDYDIFLFGRKMYATMDGPIPLFYHQRFFAMCFGYNPPQ